MTDLSFSQDPLLHVTPAVKPLLFACFVIQDGMKEKKPYSIVISNEQHSFDHNGIACITGASRAKRGERDILREAQNEREAREEGRRKNDPFACLVMQANTGMDWNQSQFLPLII